MNPTGTSGSGQRRGLALVETALTLPLLLLLLVGALEYAWLFFKFQQVNSAARHGARIGVTVPATQTQVQAAIDQMMTSSGLQASGYTVTFSADPAALNPGEVLTISISVPYANVELIGFPLVPTPVTLIGATSMVKEGPL